MRRPNRLKKTSISPYVRLFTKNNKTLFKHQMDEIDWGKKVYSAPDVDTAYNNFISEIQAVFNSSFPLTQLSIRGSKDKKWMTIGLKSSSNKKQSLFRRWLKSRQKTDEEKYKIYKKIFDRAAKAAEIKYYKENFDNRSSNV